MSNSQVHPTSFVDSGGTGPMKQCRLLNHQSSETRPEHRAAPPPPGQRRRDSARLCGVQSFANSEEKWPNRLANPLRNLPAALQLPLKEPVTSIVETRIEKKKNNKLLPPRCHRAVKKQNKTKKEKPQKKHRQTKQPTARWHGTGCGKSLPRAA